MILPLELRNTFMIGDVRDRLAQLPDESVHCVVTSPPYWSMRDYGAPGQFGLEPTLAEYIADLVDICEGVKRVLRDDGTFWLNIGDGYIGARRGAGDTHADKSTLEGSRHSQDESRRARESFRRDRRDVGDVHHKASPGLGYKQLMLQPMRAVCALQDAGWIVRCDVIWAKPNPTPESTRDRPTRAHEYLFLLTKRRHYFYDQEAIREPFKKSTIARLTQKNFAAQKGGAKDYRNGVNPSRSVRKVTENVAGNGSQMRNKRSVWNIAPQASKIPHFAMFPEKLVEPCIKAGTSEVGCCSVCGSPWRRQIDVKDPEKALGKSYHDHADDFGRGQHAVPSAETAPYRVTAGWAPSCTHEALPVPCIVLDPFMGSGTTALVAATLGRDYLGIELNPEYVAIAEKRLAPVRSRLL